MRITASMMARQAIDFIRSNSEGLDQSLERLGTGRKILRPSDDLVGSTLALKLQDDLSVMDGDHKRLDRSLSSMQTMDSALTQAINLLQRARELVLQASGDELNNDQRSAIAREVRELRKELVQVANTKLGDRYLFSGTATLTKPFVFNPSDDVIYQGDSQSSKLTLSNGETYNLTLPGSSVFQSTEDIFDTLKDAVTAMETGDTSSLRDSILSRLDNGLKQILSSTSSIGAQVNRGDRTKETFGQQINSITATLSSIVDADIAEETINLQVRQASLQATLLATSRILSSASLVNYMA